jgi:hypothetical protein
VETRNEDAIKLRRRDSLALAARCRALRLWLVIETAAAALIGALWLAAVPISLMAFGAPGSAVTLRAWAFVLTLWSYPLWTFGPIAVAWFLLARGHARAAARLSLVPPLAGLAVAALFWR